MSYIRTRSMSSHSTYTPSVGHTNLLLNLTNLMSPNRKSQQPPGLGLGHSDWRSSGVRTRTRPRASAFSNSRRYTPAPTQSIKFDPFADDTDSFGSPPPSPTTATHVHEPVLYRTPRTTPASLSSSISTPPRTHPPPQQQHPTFTLHVSPQQRAADRDAKSRLVAGILLNRVHAVGRPMRRRSVDGPREYVKSGLSSVISVEA